MFVILIKIIFMLSKPVILIAAIVVEINVAMNDDVPHVNSLYMMDYKRMNWGQLKKTIEMVKK
jgi:hypothetical protein